MVYGQGQVHLLWCSLMLAGQYDSASQLIQKNTELIMASGAKTLILSCPICYKAFREDYVLQAFPSNFMRSI
jgi:Fe-S oxidoreductase